MLSFILSVTPKKYHDKIKYLFENFHDDMLRIARARLRKANDPDPEHNAEDIVQNCFLRISEYCESIKFECDYKDLKAYVITITANESHRFIQKQQYFEELEENYEYEPESYILEEIISEENYNSIVEAIKDLDEKYSIPLFYYFVEEISPKEISELLGLPKKTVYTRISRGKAKLIEKINDKGIK